MAEVILSSAVLEAQEALRLPTPVQLASLVLEAAPPIPVLSGTRLAAITLEETPLSVQPQVTVVMQGLCLEARLSKPNTKLGNIFF